MLDLGCGPGLDAAALTALGYRVLAVDGSVGMVREARARGVDAHVCDLSDDAALREVLSELGPFDGALSNFGALNCVRSLRPLGAVLRDLLRPEATLLAVVMGPRCVAEDLVLLRNGHRPRRRDGPVPVEGADVHVRYLRPGTLLAELAPPFRLVAVEALGVLDAPPDLGGAPGRRTRLEPWLARLPGLRSWGDHTLVTLCR